MASLRREGKVIMRRGRRGGEVMEGKVGKGAVLEGNTQGKYWRGGDDKTGPDRILSYLSLHNFYYSEL